MLYSREGSRNSGDVGESFHGFLFLYGQDSAPFRVVRWLPAFRRACLSTPLYKNNPLMGKRIDAAKITTEILYFQIYLQLPRGFFQSA